MATGNLFGLPGQTIEDIAKDLLLFKGLNVPMLSAGPYIEAKGTPLQISKSEFLISNKTPNTKSPSFAEATDGKQILNTAEARLELALKFIAVARFLMPEVKIPVTTALETLDKENGRHKGLLAGANSLMFDLTPEKYSKNYNIYDNRYREREQIWQKYGLFKGEESWEMLEEKMRLS